MRLTMINAEIRGCEQKTNKKGEDYLVVRVEDETGKAEELCDKVIIINKGVVVANDNIANLTKESDNVLVVEFDGNVTMEMLRNIVGLKQAKAIKENHWILESKADLDIRQDLMRWAINNNVIIKSMQREETSIEECFQRLTRV